MNHCANCGHPVHDLYCSHCGQKIRLERISFAYVWKEIFHFFTHIDKGFLYTSWKMIIQPGTPAIDYVKGKRKRYQSPISYFLIWITIYILFLYWLEKLFGENEVINYKEYFGPGATTRFAISHLALVLTLVIPFQALYLWLLVTRSRENYFETMVATIYSLGTIILFQFLFAFLSMLLHLMGSGPIDLKISDILKVLYIGWFILHFIRQYKLKFNWLRVLVYVLLAFGTFSAWRLYGVPALFHPFSSGHS